MDTISIRTVIIGLATIAVTAGLLLVWALVRARKNAEGKSWKILATFGAILAIVAMLSGVTITSKINQALDHGLYSYDIAYAKLDEAIANSPYEMSDDFPTNETPTNTIVVMYRFTCPDCESIYHELNARLAGTRYPVYWISSRSGVGITLRDAYDIQEVPSIIAFDANGRASVAVAYYSDSAGNPVMDTSAVDIAITTLDAQATLDHTKTTMAPIVEDTLADTTDATDVNDVNDAGANAVTLDEVEDTQD